MYPYNKKVWAHSPRYMNSVWVGERVAATDLMRVIKNIINNTDDVSWGPNNTFRFPLRGGTGAIWKNLAEKIGGNNIAFKHEVERIDTKKQVVYFKNKEEVKYDHLINTMPMDLFVQKSDLPDEFKEASKNLDHSTVYIIGIGLEGKPKKEITSKCWMYFPEDNCPFYRVTLFSKYSPYNVPDNKKHWSLMAEVASSKYKPVDEKKILDQVITGMKNTQLINNKDKIVSTWLHKENYGYPTPTIERDDAIRKIIPELMKRNILSRGRFGMWKYEVSNQDHSCMQGVEAANYIIHGVNELTAFYPEIVNGPKPY
jgi:protoporphyrinogen oxidase